MTGKLDLNLGLDYEFNPRRAKQVAEGRAILGDSTVIDGAAVPINGVPASSQWTMEWYADGSLISVTHTAPAVQTKPEVLAALAALGLADVSVSQVDSNNEVVLLLTAGPELNAGTIYQAAGGAVAPPDGVYGPYTSPHGDQWWNQRENGVWWVWWDIDADPDPDIRRNANSVVNDPNLKADYRADIRASLEANGWPS